MWLVSCILRNETLDKGVEAIDGPWRETSIPCQCYPFEGHWENTTKKMHRHWCRDSPGWGMCPDVHLDRLFHHTTLGWAVSNLRVGQPPWCCRQRGIDESSTLLGNVCVRDWDRPGCWWWVGGVIPLESIRALCGKSARRPGGVSHEPRPNHDQHLAFLTPPRGVTPSP